MQTLRVVFTPLNCFSADKKNHVSHFCNPLTYFSFIKIGGATSRGSLVRIAFSKSQILSPYFSISSNLCFSPANLNFQRSKCKEFSLPIIRASARRFGRLYRIDESPISNTSIFKVDSIRWFLPWLISCLVTFEISASRSWRSIRQWSIARSD